MKFEFILFVFLFSVQMICGNDRKGQANNKDVTTAPKAQGKSLKEQGKTNEEKMVTDQVMENETLNLLPLHENSSPQDQLVHESDGQSALSNAAKSL